MLHNQVIKTIQVLCVTLDKYTNHWAHINEMTSLHDALAIHLQVSLHSIKNPSLMNRKACRGIVVLCKRDISQRLTLQPPRKVS